MRYTYDRYAYFPFVTVLVFFGSPRPGCLPCEGAVVFGVCFTRTFLTEIFRAMVRYSLNVILRARTTVDSGGIEPPTFAMPWRRSPAELRAHDPGAGVD